MTQDEGVSRSISAIMMSYVIITFSTLAATIMTATSNAINKEDRIIPAYSAHPDAGFSFKSHRFTHRNITVKGSSQVMHFNIRSKYSAH